MFLLQTDVLGGNKWNCFKAVWEAYEPQWCHEKKKKSADETLKIIKEILDYNEEVQKAFALASKVDKGKSEPKPEESIAERVKLRRQKSEEKEFNKF